MYFTALHNAILQINKKGDTDMSRNENAGKTGYRKRGRIFVWQRLRLE
jgi:hypothetical protein